MRTSLFLVATLGVAAAVFVLAGMYFQSEETSKAQGRLSLYESTVRAELQRFSHLTYVLARDPFVVATAEGGSPAPLNARLANFARQAELDAIYLMRPDGLTISASNAKTPRSFVGQDYSFRPYFKDALNGTQGRFYGIGATTGLPGYFIADAVKNAGGEVKGVIAIKIDLGILQDSWSEAGEEVLLANSDGVVLLSSSPDWRYRTLTPLNDTQRGTIEASRQFTGQPLNTLNWSATGINKARIDGNDRLHLVSSGLPHDWQLHYFASPDRATALTWLATAATVVLAGIAFIFYQVQKTQRIGAALKRSEEEEGLLREANARLAVEIEERRTAQRRLQRTQDELERAGRLAALGQLAASVTHELGQPIAAMRNHLAAAELRGQGGEGVTSTIGGLVDRMEGITRQLKFFARSEAEDFADVDLYEAMMTSRALVEPNVEAQEVQVEIIEPKDPIRVRGSKLRIEQVMTNLLRNSIDAMEDADTREITVRFHETPNEVWFEIEDTGHGLGSTTLAELQEPFVTTRESGQGMGLGLTISAGIVSDHGGELTARNSAAAGAVFRVSFPREAHSESTAA